MPRIISGKYMLLAEVERPVVELVGHGVSVRRRGRRAVGVAVGVAAVGGLAGCATDQHADVTTMVPTPIQASSWSDGSMRMAAPVTKMFTSAAGSRSFQQSCWIWS